MMTIQMHLEYMMRVMNMCAAYVVIQLGRSVLISIVMTAVILLLRKTLLRNAVFMKGMIWSLLLLAPFMGKMTWIYETRIGVRLLYRWQELCSRYIWVNWMYLAGMVGMACYMCHKRKKLKRLVDNMKTVTVCDTKVYVSEFEVSPFTTGIVKPRIVIPKMMLEQLQPEEIHTILLHEKVHIQLGHLWCYLLWDFLRIVLWLNPFLTICTKHFQADMEDICDRVTLQKGKQTAYVYGSLLLKSIRMLGSADKGVGPSVAFAAEKEYRSLKKRMERIAAYQPYKRLSVSCLVLCCVLLLTGAFVKIKKDSYPAYTSFNTVQLYNRDGSGLLVGDCEELHKAIRIDEKYVYINRNALDMILEKNGVEEDMFFLFFGGFYKLPGIGGGGNGIFVEYGEQNGDLVLPYIDGETDLLMKLCKYL